MGTWNKKKAIRVSILGVVVILVIITGRYFTSELSKSDFQRLAEAVVSVLRVDMKCESRDIGTVEHIACQGSDDERGVFALFADYPEPRGELTSYFVTEGNMVIFNLCQGRAVDVTSFQVCQIHEEIHISEAVSRLDRIQMAWEAGQLRLGRN